VRKYIKNKPRVVSVMLAEGDQKRVGLTEKDLLARDDAIEQAAKDEDEKAPGSKAPRSGAGKLSTPRKAGAGRAMGNRKP
jgi:hypothetical protein